MVVGSFQEIAGEVYVVVNPQGTLERHGKIKWYYILALAFLQAVGKVTKLQEVREYLRRGRVNHA